METVSELWRYPVKSMQGEQLVACDITVGGLAGDRAYAVVDRETGRVGSAKHPRLWGELLQCRAAYVSAPGRDEAAPPVSITFPDGTQARSDEADMDGRLSALLGRPVSLTTVAPERNTYVALWPRVDGVAPDDFRRDNQLLPAAGAPEAPEDSDEASGTLTSLSLGLASGPGTFFDVAPLHLVTTATLRRLGELSPGSEFAVSRFRPNVVIDGPAEPFGENDWTSAILRLGPAVTATAILPTMRCIMTTLAQGALRRDPETLRAVARHNRIEIPGLGIWSCVGAYAVVSAAGPLNVGDAARVEAAAGV